MTFIGLQILKMCKLNSLKCLVLMVAECCRKKCYNLEQSNQTIYTGMAKQVVFATLFKVQSVRKI